MLTQPTNKESYAVEQLREKVRAVSAGSISADEAVDFINRHQLGPRELQNALKCTKDDLTALMQANQWQRDDVARYLHVSERQIMRWMAEGTNAETSSIPHKYGALILNLDRIDEDKLYTACRKWAHGGEVEAEKVLNLNGTLSQRKGARTQITSSHSTLGALSMPLKEIPADDMCVHLTNAQAEAGMGAIKGYFMFTYGQLYAASYDAFPDGSTRLREGYAIVEAPAIRTVCDSLETAGRAMSRDTELFGDLRTLILGFANSIVTMTVPEPDVHLIAVFHPKRLYNYGAALSVQRKTLELAAKGPVPIDPDEVRKSRDRNPFAAGVSPDHVNDISLGSLLKAYPSDLSKLMSRTVPVGSSPAYAEQTASSSRGFVLLEQGESEQPSIRSASSSVVDVRGGSLRYRDECKALAMREFGVDILRSLIEGQELLHDARTVVQVTGRLRTFWLSFDNAVIGINPFDDRRAGVKGAQYYLLSVYRAASSGYLKFNYGKARELIRSLCQDADSI
jgi:hypothetical protein